MWTNVFKIGGLHQLSWFQFIPNESDHNSQPDISLRGDKKDARTLLVLSSHLQLQKEGFLSSWTNSFTGPWDPSQGPHNPDEKIKLWLFLPGRRSSVVETAQAAVSKLIVVASGIWLSPGDSEEVAAALSQALRNSIERSLIGLSYMRFGDVFSQCQPFSPSEELFRKGKPIIEFIFAATEEAIFVHAIVSAKHIRNLSNGDMENVLKHSSNNSDESLSVIVSPHGMRGKLTGFCPSDLVKQVYFSSGKFRVSNGSIGLSYHGSYSASYQPRVQSCYAEVTMGMPSNQRNKLMQSNSNLRTFPKHNFSDGSLDNSSICERTFIYPPEAILIPNLQTSSARSSLKRFWLQNWIGPPFTGSSFFMPRVDTVDEQSNEQDGSSSSNSNSSSISTLSSNSSDSDFKMTTTKASDFEADADSLACRKSGLSNDQVINNSKDGSKRSRAEMVDLYGQVGAVASATMKNVLNSDYASIFAITESENDQIGSQWDLDEDDGGIGLDIEILLSDFGGFDDLFENDSWPFGELPGPTDSQALMLSASDYDVIVSPRAEVMNVSDQMLLPVGFPSFESFNPPTTSTTTTTTSMEELGLIKTQEEVVINTTNDHLTIKTNDEFNYLIQAEALMTFAPEYGAFETPSNEFSSSIFKMPYFPKVRKGDSSNSSSESYVYGPIPRPSSPSGDKSDISLNSKKLYTVVERGIVSNDKKYITSSNNNTPHFTNAVNCVKTRMLEGTFERENLFSSMKTLLATEVDCISFQAFMCRTRHTLVSSSGLRRSTGFNHLLGIQATMTEPISTVPVRIAGDIDGVLDGPSNGPVGVWRSVGNHKVANSNKIEVSSSLPNSYNEDSSILSYAAQQRHPLHELLDGLSLLVQQATADVALEADCSDGPYGWLVLQEQCRRGFSCGPFMTHAGCGGSLASCHSLDIAGMELMDSLSVDVQASSVINFLQSDIKTALKSAFGILDGPLSVTDWCKGCGPLLDADGFSPESTLTMGRDSSSTVTLSVGDAISPSFSSTSGSSYNKDGGKVDETCQRRSNQETGSSDSEQQLASLLRPSLYVLPLPAILVGYQDDWLKTSTNSLQLWDKAPFEPYALQKHMTYYVVCPDIDPLTSAAADFFQQLGTVYGACNLGTHSPQNLENQTNIIGSGKSLSSSGFALLDCPQSMKIESSNASLVGSLSDYFLSLSNGWDLTSFLKSLSKVLRTLKLGSSLTISPKDGNTGSCTVIYVVCPFPEPAAVLQTIIESSVTIGSIISSSAKEKRAILHNRVDKALSCSSVLDDSSSSSNILTLSGFNIPKLVLQIVTVDAIFRVTSPSLNELVILKETAFAVYKKARRISRGSSNVLGHSSSSSLSSQPHSVLMQMNSPMSGIWDNNSWQTTTIRPGNFTLHDDIRYMFEPLFILAEPGSIAAVNGNLPSEDSLGGSDGKLPSDPPSPPSLHCCYEWTEDWRWLICIWTDSRGELLDSHVFPFGGISSRQDTKGLQCLFGQVLQQGCEILQACCSDTGGTVKPRDFVITRIGCFYELECQEWQKAIYTAGGMDMKKWPIQLRRSSPDGITASTNGPSMQQQEMILTHERTLSSSSNPLYKSSGYTKGGLGQPSSRKQIMSGNSSVETPKGLLQWAQSISLVAILIDHSLHFVSQMDSSSPGGTQSGTGSTPQNYKEGFSPVKPLDSSSSSYIMIPSPSMKFLSSKPLQLPPCLTAESPPLAHLLHSKGSAIPLSTGFVVSKSVPSMRKDSRSNFSKDEWPSVISVSLVDYYGADNIHFHEKNLKKRGGNSNLALEIRDFKIETQMILENVAAELHALSWMTVSPACLERRSALPFHCDVVLRLRRLLYFAEKELSRQPNNNSQK